MRSRIALLALAALGLVPLAADAPPNPFETEAPSALYDFEIGDADVSLFATGTWTTGFAPAVGWLMSRTDDGSLRSLPGYDFPGLESVPFEQQVNLTLSLWLLQRYFFETTVSEQIEESTILFGYAGREDETVQSVLAGNTAIGIGTYPFLDFGDETGSVGQDAPGASAAFRTGRSTHELMVRYAPSEREEIVYADGGIVSETRVSASEYERNRHFVLPDGSLDSLELYLESPSGDFTDGDGRRYRLLDLDTEVVFSLADGVFSLREAPTTRLLVYYEAGGVPIGDAALGRASCFGLDADGRPDPDTVLDFSFESTELRNYAELFEPLDPDELTVTLTGDGTDREAFLIHQPGRFSPFATAATYERPESAGGTVELEAAPGSRYPSSLDLVVSDARETVTVGSLAGDPRAFENRYPLASELAERPVPGIYGPAPAEPPQTPDLVFRSVTPAETIELPEEFIPGSVRIERNGTVETRFVVEDSGRIVFDTPLRRTDVVRVSFRTSAASGAEDLLFASGNRFELAPGTNAQLALGARLKPSRARYSTRADEYPGRLTLSGSVETRSSSWRTPPPGELDAHLAGAVSLSSPDTSGVLRVAGMNDGARSFPVSPTALFLAPRSLDAGPGPDLSAGGRGFLHFADHLSVNALGDRSYLPYTADPQAVSPSEYAAGGRGGPYPASTPPDDDYAGTVAVFDYEIPSDRSWVAGLVRIDGGRGTDLSDARRIVVPYRVVEASPEAARLTFELGAIGEDLDGDGTRDTGADALAFHDSSNGFTLATGAPPPAGLTYSEDANGNGVLDPELPDLVLAHPVDEDDLTDDGAGWQELEIDLTAAEARRLADTRAMRVVIEPATAGDAVAGKIVVGAIDVFGSEFSVEASGSPPEVTTSVFPETEANADRLGKAFPQVASRLTDEDPEQRVLRVGWDDAGTGDTITLSRATAVRAADYEELRIYYRAPSAQAAGAEIMVRASDGDGAFEAELAEPAIVADGAWHELSLPLPTDVDAVVRRIDVEIATNGVEEAVVLFDELSFWGPRTSVGAVAQAELAWRPDVEITVDGTNVLSDVAVEQRLHAETASLPDDPDARRSGLESSTDVSATVLGAQAAAGLDARTVSAGTGLQGRHEVTMAPRVVPLRLVDSFQAGYGVFGPGTSHETSFELTIPAIGVVETDWVSVQRDSSRVAWSASASAGGTATRTRDSTQVAGDRDEDPAERRSPGVTVGAHAELSETSATADGVPPYPVAWTRSFSRLAPTASPQQRDASASLEGSLAFAGVGLDAAAGSSFDADAAAARRGVETFLELGVPWRAGDRFDVSVKARRELSIETEGAPRPRPADDVAAAAELLADYPLVVAFVPLAELFAGDYPERSADLSLGLLASRYRPQLSLEARRGITSSPWSLLVPTGVELSAARPARRDLDAATSSYELSGQALLVAPNLFGRLGVRPLFGFYDSDEFQSRARLEVTGGDGAPWETAIGFSQSTRLIWTDDRSVELETFVTTVVPDDGTRQLTVRLAHLRSRPTERFAGPLLPRVLAEAEGTIEHESSLTVEYDQTPGDRLLARLEHATSLRFDEAGTIRLHGGFGAGTQTFAGEPGTLVGLRVGIEGRLRL